MSQKSRTPYMDVPADRRLAACVDDLLGPESDTLSCLDKTVMEDPVKNGFRLYDRMRDALSSLRDTPADLDAFMCRFIEAPLFSKFAHMDSSNLLYILESAHRIVCDAPPLDGMNYPLDIINHPDLDLIAEREPRKLLHLLPMLLSQANPGKIPSACKALLNGSAVYVAGIAFPLNGQTAILRFFPAVEEYKRDDVARYILRHPFMDRLAVVNAGQYLSLITGLLAHLPKGNRLSFLNDSFQTPPMLVAFSNAKLEEDKSLQILMQIFGYSAGPADHNTVNVSYISDFLKFALGTALDHLETSGETSPVNLFMSDALNGPCLAAAERRDPKGMAHLTAAASVHTLRELTRLKHNNPVNLTETILSRLGDGSNAPARAATYLGHLFSLLRPEEWPMVLESETFSALIQKRPEILPAFYFPAIKAMDASNANVFKEAIINSRSFSTYRATHAGKAQAIEQFSAVPTEKNPAGQSPAGP